MDESAILMFLAVFPIFLILIFIYTKDYSREPVRLLLRLFILGGVACSLVLCTSRGISYIMPSLERESVDGNLKVLLVYNLLRVALLEEFYKWIMVYFFGYKNRNFDESFDVIVYAVFVSLGFSFLENIIFILANAKLHSIILRAFLSVPGHACFGIFMGYYLGIARQCTDKKKKTWNFLLSIIIPVLIHGIYDFCLMSGSKILVFIFIIFIISIYILSYHRLRKCIMENKNY